MNKMLRFSIPVLAALLALAALFFIMGASAQATAGGRASTQTAIIVTSLDDELNSDGDCALREAIQAVNTNAAVDACPAGNVLTDMITFAVAGTITVTTQLEILATGGPLMIDGGEVITVSGGGSSGVFRVLGGIALTIQRLAVTDGYAYNSHGAGLYNEGGYIIIDHCEFVGNHFNFNGIGGGIYSSGGTLTVLDSRFEANGAIGYVKNEGSGGGIAIMGSVAEIYRSTFLRNDVYHANECSDWGAGGGALLYAGDSLIIQDSNFISNTSQYGGGAIVNEGTITLTNNTFSGNSAVAPCNLLPAGAIANYGSMTILSNTISGNSVTNGGAGGIVNNVSLTILNSTISDNNSVNGGAGGIINSGSLTVLNSTFSNNTSVNGGTGGAISHVGTLLDVANSTFSSNHSFEGGGINNHALLTVLNSTFSGNSATNGGGINSPAGAVTIVNTTFSGNSAATGGGINKPAGAMTIVNTTFSGNSATTGGGVNGGGGGTILTNTIVANSPVGGDCAGAITDGGHNLASDNTCGFDPANGSLPGTDPLLGPLQDNGGATWTHALPENSPAMDAGDNDACPETDQRGVMRPIDGDGDGEVVCEIGAYEFQPAVYFNPPSRSGSGVPGAVVDYSLAVYNWSPLTDTFTLALGPHAWQTELSALQVGPLEPGDVAPLTVSVSIPLDAPWYLTNTVMVTATSLTSPTMYQATARLNTSIFSVAPAEISISGPQTGLASYPYTFTAAVSPISTTLPITYTWLAEEGQPPITHIAGLSDTTSIAWATPGVYTLTVSAVNYRAAISNTLVIAISDEPIAWLSFSKDYPALVGVPIHFTATVSSGTNIIYSWTFGDGAIGSGATVTHTYTTVGWYNTVVWAQNSANIQGYWYDHYIADVPITGLEASNDGPTLIGEATLFTATVEGGTNVTYSWDFGDGAIGSGATIAHTYTTPDIYVATVTAQNSIGWLTDTTSATIFAYPVYLPLALK